MEFALHFTVISTLVVWVVMFGYRKRILTGLEGPNGHLEAGELVIFIIAWLTPPAISWIVFMTQYTLYGLAFIGIVTGYALTGRYIFDWAIAIRSGANKVETETKPQ